MKTQIKPVVAAIALAMAASPAWALTDFYLAAKQYTKSLPDGTNPGFDVTMWGYVQDVNVVDVDGDGDAGAGGPEGDCYETANIDARRACVAALPDPAVPGPQLVVPPGENQIRIFLTNGLLQEPTSIVIPGQELPWSNANNGPTWDGGGSGDANAGPRSSADQRVRSFGREAGPNGGRRAYVWNTGRGTNFDGPGTFLYHSGTHPQKQVYMGLAGLLTQDFAAVPKAAYEGVPYDNEVTLFYSDIDPAFNEAVANGTLTTAIDRHPSWFLVNGEPYEANVTGGIPAGAAGADVLVRMASTATDTHVVVMQGLNMTLHAEDGQQYNYQEGATITPAPREQYSAMLPPAKTKDAIVVAPLEGSYAVYDGNGYMTNPSDPTDEQDGGDEVGGMLRFLAVGGGGTNQAPTANNDLASVVTGFSTGINVLGNDTDPESDPLSIASFDVTGTPGLVTCVTGVVAGACSYDATGVAAGTPVSFTYIATDGTDLSAAATVTVTVTANLPPTPVDDTATADQGGAPVTIDVLANDTDPEGVLAVVPSSPTAAPLGGSVTCSTTDCQYTPPAAPAAGADSFTYNVTDGVNPDVPATVTVTVVVPNELPVANDDPTVPLDPAFSTGINTQLVGIDVLGNDTDADAGPSPLTIQSYDATGTATVGDPPVSGAVACVTGVATGTCTYTPPPDYTGTDTFTYTVTDGADTDVATVTIDVVGAGGTPALYFSTFGAGTVPGVAGPYDDADVYTVDTGGVFSRFYDAIADLGLGNAANIDGISINGTDVYVSFAASSTAVPGFLGGVPDEDVVVYNTVGGTWSTFFDGSTCNLDSNNNGDIDAVSVVGTTLYFSTLGNVNVSGPSGGDDDADVYSWDSSVAGAVCARPLDGGTNGLGGQDIDALTVQGTAGSEVYYISTEGAFNGAGDEAVHVYNGGGSWSVYRANGELSATDTQDVDAIHVPTP